MINSMTGFGRASETIDAREITAEIKAVNHRYFEFSSRVPRSLSFLEDKIKAHVQSRVSRGKIDVGVTFVAGKNDAPAVELNMELARSYAESLDAIASQLGLNNDATASTIARFPDVFTQKRAALDEDKLWSDVRTVLDEALDSFESMRGAEGEKLEADILSRLDTIERAVKVIEEQSAPRLEAYRDKLLERMKAVLGDSKIDESRVLLEAALYADKAAVDEETVRLRSHLSQFREIMRAKEPVGRKLDFLTQEINREINTIGSKAGDLGITGTVVDVKAEIEKIREQIQNIE